MQFKIGKPFQMLVRNDKSKFEWFVRVIGRA